MKRYLPFVLIALVAVGAVGGGTLLYRKQVAELSTAKGGASGSVTAPDVQSRGNPTAAVTLEEFGDYQCPPCGAVALLLPKLETQYGSKLRVVFRHFPLEGHKHAREAAYFAEAAGLQGKFWEMHETIYRHRENWTNLDSVTPIFSGYGSELGLDAKRLRDDVQSQAVRDRVERDLQLAKARGVNATPTIFVNGKLVPPANLGEAGVRQAIDAALRDVAQPAASPQG
jgi:protein-disulfide isomerase